MKVHLSNNNAWSDGNEYIMGTASEVHTNALFDIYPNDTTITAEIKGNTVQSGTPSPSQPCDVLGCGERTGNLWNEDYTGISGTITYEPLYVGDGNFTLSTTTPYDSLVASLFLLSGNVSSGASSVENGVWLNHKVTAAAENGYITIAYRHFSGTTSPTECKTMLNSGSTALPYESYGYKIPILSGGTTTPVYLGEVQTTRQIKKLVLDGTENWTVTSVTGATRFSLYVTGITDKQGIGSHYKWLAQTGGTDHYYSSTNYLFIFSETIATEADFKAYLSQQYAAGTPVTFWYILATPTTGIVNEPLMKIGDYSDAISSISLTTTAGEKSFSVDTAVKPSEITLNFRGWHPKDPKESTGGEWS